MKRVACIIVTYNRLGLLQECVDSLRQQSYDEYSIIVVDNGSTDNTAEWLRSQRDIIVISQENSGGAGGFFSGIKYACEHGYEYSWVMDDDVILSPDTLQELINASIYSDGFVCSRVIDMDGNHCNVPKLSACKSKNTGELLWGELINKNLLRVDIASFVSVLLKNKIVYEVGLPYKEYFIWGDDTEYTSRISSKYASYMAMNSVVIHKRKIGSVLSIYTETNLTRVHNFFYAYRNRIHCQRKIITKAVVFIRSCFDVLKLICLGCFYKAFVIGKGVLSSIFFYPSIKYPNKC